MSKTLKKVELEELLKVECPKTGSYKPISYEEIDIALRNVFNLSKGELVCEHYATTNLKAVKFIYTFKNHKTGIKTVAVCVSSYDKSTKFGVFVYCGNDEYGYQTHIGEAPRAIKAHASAPHDILKSVEVLESSIPAVHRTFNFKDTELYELVGELACKKVFSIEQISTLTEQFRNLIKEGNISYDAVQSVVYNLAMTTHPKNLIETCRGIDLTKYKGIEVSDLTESEENELEPDMTELIASFDLGTEESSTSTESDYALPTAEVPRLIFEKGPVESPKKVKKTEVVYLDHIVSDIKNESILSAINQKVKEIRNTDDNIKMHIYIDTDTYVINTLDKETYTLPVSYFM